MGLIGGVLPAVFGQQRIMEDAQISGGNRCAPAQLPGQRRIGDQPPPQHHGHAGIPGLQRLAVLRGEEVAVEHQGDAAGEGQVEAVQMHAALVELAAGAGVDGQLPDGVLFQDIQQGGPFPGRLEADAGLDGDGQRGGGKDGVQKGVQRLRVAQHTGALALAGHGAGGAADVEVHLVILQVGQLSDRPEEELWVAGQQLGDDRYARILGRGDGPEIAGGENVVLRRGDKGDVIRLHPAENAVMHPAVDGVGHALHGGKAKISMGHGRPPDGLMEFIIAYFAGHGKPARGRRLHTFFAIRQGCGPGWRISMMKLRSVHRRRLL